MNCEICNIKITHEGLRSITFSDKHNICFNCESILIPRYCKFEKNPMYGREQKAHAYYEYLCVNYFKYSIINIFREGKYDYNHACDRCIKANINLFKKIVKLESLE